MIYLVAGAARSRKTPKRVIRDDFTDYRLREHPTWGCSWLAQGWAAVADLTKNPYDAEITYAVADWVTERQLKKMEPSLKI